MDKKINDPNDFFDDTIDDEIDSDLETVEDDDDVEMFEEDDDESVNIRTVLLVKNDMLALLGLKTSEQKGLIFRCDPRQDTPSARAYDDPAAATMWFKRSLSTSVKNGWSVLYDGEPLLG